MKGDDEEELRNVWHQHTHAFIRTCATTHACNSTDAFANRHKQVVEEGKREMEERERE